MKIALTGTPGTGKTTIGKMLRDVYGLKVVDLNEVIHSYNYCAEWDEDRGCSVVDLDALKAHQFCDGLILEGHLSHHLTVDRVIVLRTHPAVLRVRLREKEYSDRKIQENVEAEILDIILAEALALHGNRNVYEVDSTGPLSRSAQLVWEIVQEHGLARFAPGRYDWSGYLDDP
jgi:adenylate kinase